MQGYLASNVVNIVCVHDSYNMAELGGPTSAVVEPSQVLWLFQNGHICLHRTPCTSCLTRAFFCLCLRRLLCCRKKAQRHKEEMFVREVHNLGCCGEQLTSSLLMLSVRSPVRCRVFHKALSKLHVHAKLAMELPVCLPDVFDKVESHQQERC